MHATPPPSRQNMAVAEKILRKLAVCSLALLLVAGVPSAHAASGTWIGASSSLWGGASNWNPNGVPGTGDTATFSNPGNGNNAISIILGSPPITIGSIIFNSASAASHNIGDDVDTMILNAAGSIAMNASVALPQNIGANLVLGTASGADAFTFTNNSVVAGAVLFFSGTISSGANSGVKTVTVTGAGITEINIGSITNGTGSVVLAKTGTGTLNLGPTSTLGFNTLNASGGTTNIDAALGSGPGTAAVTVTNAASLRFGSVSQRLSSLTIGAGSTVTFTSGTASPFAASESGAKSGSLPAAIVPEPASLGLLLAGALRILLRRRRA